MSATPVRLRIHIPGTANDARWDSPRREPGAVRRTTTIDTIHPEGPGREVLVVSRGRDARTRADGSLEVLDSAMLQAALAPDRTLLSVEGGPGALRHLLGRRVAGGFRAAVREAIPEHARSGRVLHQLLDDWVGAVLVAGMAELDVTGPVPTTEQVARQHDNAALSVDLCAGWAAEASLVAAVRSPDGMPISLGPVAPVLGRPDDPDGWPDGVELRPGDSRRTRRLDLRPEDGQVALDVHFRDSWVGIDGLTRVVHEYSLHGRFDPVDEVITSIVPTAHVLPWPECPAAVASALRVVGLPLVPLRDTVRREFTGTTTCTHLNDVLRSLADLPVLARQTG